MATKQWQDRMKPETSFEGFWSKIFGVGFVDLDADADC